MASPLKYTIYKYDGSDEYFDQVFLTKNEILEHLQNDWHKVILKDKQMVVFVKTKENIYKLQNLLSAVKLRGASRKVQFTRFSKN